MTQDKYLKTVAAVVGLIAIYVSDSATVDAIGSILTAVGVFLFPK